MCQKSYCSHSDGINENIRSSRGGALPENEEGKSYLETDKNTPVFQQQLSQENLEIRDIVGDGNCLFRALADQMDGDSENHLYYRDKICDYIEGNRSDFEPFLVDNVKFEDYVTNLRQCGTYAGNDAIVAFAKLFKVHIIIHQLGRIPMSITYANDPNYCGAQARNDVIRELHISYHNNEHYASVRKINDRSICPTRFVKRANDSSSTSSNTSCNICNGFPITSGSEKMEIDNKTNKRKNEIVYNSDVQYKKPKSL